MSAQKESSQKFIKEFLVSKSENGRHFAFPSKVVFLKWRCSKLCQLTSFPVVDAWFFCLITSGSARTQTSFSWEKILLSSWNFLCRPRIGRRRRSLFVFAAGLTLVAFYAAGQQHLGAPRPWPILKHTALLSSQNTKNARILRTWKADAYSPNREV